MFRRFLFRTAQRASAGVCSSGQAPLAAAPSAVAARVAEAAFAKLTTETFMKEVQRAIKKFGGCLGQMADLVMRIVSSRAAFIVDFIKTHPKLATGPLLAALAVAIVYAVYKGLSELTQPIQDVNQLASRLLADISGGVSPEMPDDFICPITHEPFVDPVIAAPSGNTYERQSLEEWIKINPTDPMTREKITSITPNRVLKSMMDRWYTNLINVSPPVAPIMVEEIAPNVEEIMPGVEIAFS